ncbi:MAG: Error-prone repair protein ImuA [Bacteroidota bacterium]|nr:Error-prone repair protein ImuA [Bacteroidota bacterium]
MTVSRNDMINQLRQDILLMEGYKPPAASAKPVELGPMASAFPHGIFPVGTLHEFLTDGPENGAASSGFIAGLVAALMASGGVAVWIRSPGSSGRVFPPALKYFGLDPGQVIFFDLKTEREALWAMEEALTCEGLAAVVAEIREVNFTASRRLQLAVEQSRVTGFLLRQNPRNKHTIACAARWKVSVMASEPELLMPGLGFPRWHIELERVRNGHPGSWQMEWLAGRFHPVVQEVRGSALEHPRKTG